MKYPEECAAFAVRIPAGSIHCECLPFEFSDGEKAIITVCGWLVCGLDIPLTRAARELVRWSRQ